MSCWKLHHMQLPAAGPASLLKSVWWTLRFSGISWGTKASTFPASQAACPATSGCMASGCMASGCMPGQMTMTFPQKCLNRFLADSGDSNPIHHEPDAVIPGLWILSRLEEMYGSHRPAETLSIRFLRPVHSLLVISLFYQKKQTCLSKSASLHMLFFWQDNHYLLTNMTGPSHLGH